MSTVATRLSTVEPAVVTVEDVLLTRRSVRAYQATPVPRAEIERLLTLAARSAGSPDCRPWQAHVLTGPAKRRLSAALLHAHDHVGKVAECEYGYQPSPGEWPEPFGTRRRRFGECLYGETLGIAASDSAGRVAHHRRNYDFFGAPVGIILTASRQPLESSLVEAGRLLKALMLAAHGAGLGTCPQASLIDFYPVLREHLHIPDEELIVCGLAMGYPDRTHPLNTLRTPREPVHAFTTFYEAGS
jgi:nitroreductase